MQVLRGDITQSGANIIVNAVNEELSIGGGVCGAIFSAAGWRHLASACDMIGYCETGEAIITNGFKLCDYVIHAVGPIYFDYSPQEAKKILVKTYVSALNEGEQYGGIIAFPLISAGIYGYPYEEALEVAKGTIAKWESNHPDAYKEILLVLYEG